MRAPVILQSLVLEHVRNRFTYYALGVGALVGYFAISQDLTIQYTTDGGSTQDLGGYVRQILFHVIALYWALVTSFDGGGVLLQEVEDGSIDMVLTSRGNRGRYVLERALGTLVAVLSIVAVASCAATLIDGATGDALRFSLVLAPVCLLPCFALIVSLCAYLSASGLDRKVGAGAFLLYLAAWFACSGWFERLWGPSVDRVVCYVLPNIWQWQMAMGKLFAGKALPPISAWALVNCCVYTAALFALATWKFKKRDL